MTDQRYQHIQSLIDEGLSLDEIGHALGVATRRVEQIIVTREQGDIAWAAITRDQEEEDKRWEEETKLLEERETELRKRHRARRDARRKRDERKRNWLALVTFIGLSLPGVLLSAEPWGLLSWPAYFLLVWQAFESLERRQLRTGRKAAIREQAELAQLRGLRKDPPWIVRGRGQDPYYRSMP